MLKTPGLLADYFEVLSKRLAVASSIKPDLPAWRDMQRDHNSPAPSERFAQPAAPPAVPPLGAAEAVGGEVAALLPTQLGVATAGVAAALPARETKTAAQRRWRTAAITSMLKAEEVVQPAALR
jgi:hypothetical protein